MNLLAQYKMNEYEPLYMFTEAEKIIDCKAKRKVERMYFIKQRFSGAVMFIIGIIAPFLLDGDATFSLITVPMGIGLLITKQKVMTFER